MAYLSLYRKYRPDTFDKVVGQNHIVRTLVNQIKNDAFSHAYLFTGPRGTGKTSVARIFARAINCTDTRDGSPCGSCDSCRELSSPSSLDILEIDAASNNGVDEIRDLREKVKYPPVNVKYKVYIIDEVHMLTPQAFNALLKTLEEPPAYTVFILATTEAHRLPATILSRCMRFDFRLLSASLLTDNLKRILDDLNRDYEPEALALIASAANGSARDSLSIADMCLSYCENKITYDSVLEALGAGDPGIICSICENIAERDVKGCLEKLTALADCGKNMAVLATDIAEAFRNVLYIKNGALTAEKLALPESVYKRLSETAKELSNSRILLILDIFTSLSGEFRFGNQPRILLEAALVKAATEPDVSNAAIVNYCKKLDDRISRLEGGFTQKKTDLAQNFQQKRAQPALDFSDVAAVTKALDKVLKSNRFFGFSFFTEEGGKIFTEGRTFNMSCPSEASFSVMSDDGAKSQIKAALDGLTGMDVCVNVTADYESKPENTDTGVRLTELFGAGRINFIK